MSVLRRTVLKVVGLAALAATCCGFGCADQNRMYEAACRPSAEYDPVSGRLCRIYTYYPDSEVYYSSYQDLYFWKENGFWKKGTEIPSEYLVGDSRVVTIQLATSHPYWKHDEVTSRHPSLATLRAQAAEQAQQQDMSALASVLDDR